MKLNDEDDSFMSSVTRRTSKRSKRDKNIVNTQAQFTQSWNDTKFFIDWNNFESFKNSKLDDKHVFHRFEQDFDNEKYVDTNSNESKTLNIDLIELSITYDSINQSRIDRKARRNTIQFLLNEKTQNISIVIDEIDIIYCANAQIMKDFVNEHSNVWYEDLNALRKNYVALKKKIDDYKLKFQKVKNDLHIVQEKLDQINATIIRFRECRDEYRSQVQENINAFQKFRRDWDKLRAQLRKIEQKNQIFKSNIETRLSSRLVYNSEDEKSNINDDLYDDLTQQFHEKV